MLEVVLQNQMVLLEIPRPTFMTHTNYSRKYNTFLYFYAVFIRTDSKVPG